MRNGNSVREAFRTLREAPELWLAEVAWRWAFGGAALALGLLTLWTWLDALPVSRVDQWMLGSGSPVLMARALNHVFTGSLARLWRGCAVLLPGLVLAWTVAASVGRAAILRTLMPESRATWRRLLGVNFLRAMVTVAAVACEIGTLVGFVRLALPKAAQPRAGAAWLWLLVLTWAIGSCWSVLNWWLTAATVSAARSRGTGEALSAAIEQVRTRTGEWAWVAFAFGMIHAAALMFFSGVAPAPLVFVRSVPLSLVAGAMTAIALMYFALTDGLAVARLVAWTRVVVASEQREMVASSEF